MGHPHLRLRPHRPVPVCRSTFKFRPLYKDTQGPCSLSLPQPHLQGAPCSHGQVLGLKRRPGFLGGTQFRPQLVFSGEVFLPFTLVKAQKSIFLVVPRGLREPAGGQGLFPHSLTCGVTSTGVPGLKGLFYYCWHLGAPGLCPLPWAQWALLAEARPAGQTPRGTSWTLTRVLKSRDAHPAVVRGPPGCGCRRDRGTFASFEDGGEGPCFKECRKLLEVGKAGRWILPGAPEKLHSCAGTSTAAQGDPHRRTTGGCCSALLRLWQSVVAARENPAPIPRPAGLGSPASPLRSAPVTSAISHGPPFLPPVPTPSPICPLRPGEPWPGDPLSPAASTHP